MPWPILSVVLLFLSLSTFAKSDKELYRDLTDLVDEVDLTRSDLSQKSPKPVNANNYKPVCVKVAKDLKKIAKRKKFKFRNASDRPRNPTNKANAHEKKAIAKFKKKPHLASYWERDETGFWYFRQIKAEDQCLTCHGKVTPAFLQEKYPRDRSRGHKYGSFMGIYSIHKSK